MKSKVGKIDVDKLKPVPVDLKKVNDVVEKEVVKRIVYFYYVNSLKTLMLFGLLILATTLQHKN